jgi:uncharacterized protein YdeI (YjbR/CyaY-like superfamily)
MLGVDGMEPIYFASAAEWRAWLKANHEDSTEVYVGFYRRSTGKQSLTWSEAVDEALCFGWIDGIRRRIDGERYTNRFTPRKPTSSWSAVNIRKVQELEAAGKMVAAGRAAFERRREDRVYSYEQRYQAKFEPVAERRFKANRTAWSYWTRQTPSYRASATYWVVSAKKPETREQRLAKLIEDCEAGHTVPPLTTPDSPRSERRA